MSELIFGKYAVKRRLAVGGMGEVFFAEQTGVPGFHRPVILKNLLPDLVAQPGFVEQFLDEARVAATLNHPNVVSIYEVGKWHGTYVLAMEFISGRNLSQLLRLTRDAGRRVSPVVAAHVIRDAALGLFHAHEARDSAGVPLNIVHRDVSPQNIMVRDDGVTKVVDFGIARSTNRAHRTQTGAIKGKLAYMAPEQAMGRPLDARADQFALGVVFWELLTGRRLVSGDDLQLITQVVSGDIAPPSRVVAGLPVELDDVVMKMLQRPVETRYGSCDQVARDLGEFLSRTSDPARPSPVRDWVESCLATENRTIDDVGDFVIPLRPSTGGISIVEGTMKLEGKSLPAGAPMPAPAQVPVARPGRAPWLAALSVVALAGVVGAWWLNRPAVIAMQATLPPPPGVLAVPPPTPKPAPPVSPPSREPAPFVAAPARRSTPKRTPTSVEPNSTAPAAATVARLVIDAEPWADVYEAGRKIGLTPMSTTLAVGSHTLVLKNNGEKLERTVTIDVPAEGAEVRINLRE